jgi:ligand-binding sensor domain-containing protein
MCYDSKRNCIWINGNEGLLQFTFHDKQFHHINALKKYEQLKDYGRFVGITLDRQGRVWFATNPMGIIIYDPDNDSVTFPFPSDSVLQKEVSNANACLYCDSDEYMWSGFWLRKGIDGIFPFKPVVTYYAGSAKKDSLNSNLILEVKEAGKGKLWVGTRNGMFILDKTTGIFKVLQKKDLPGIQTSDGFMTPVAVDTLNQKAWLRTDRGTFKMDMLSKKCTPVIFKKLNNVIISDPGVPKLDGNKIFFTSYNDKTKTQQVFLLNFNDDIAHEILSFNGFLFNIFNTVPVENHFLFLQGNTDEKDNRTYENKNSEWRLVHTAIDSIRWTYIAYIKQTRTYWVAGENQLFLFDDKLSYH